MTEFNVPKDRLIMIQHVVDDDDFLVKSGNAQYNPDLSMFYDYTNKMFVSEKYIAGWTELPSWNMREGK